MNSVMTKQFYKQRSDFEKSCVTRDEKLIFPDGVDFSENIAYAESQLLQKASNVVFSSDFFNNIRFALICHT